MTAIERTKPALSNSVADWGGSVKWNESGTKQRRSYVIIHMEPKEVHLIEGESRTEASKGYSDD